MSRSERFLTVVLAVLVAAMFAVPARAADVEEKWVFFTGKSLTSDETVREVIDLMERAKAAGYTHLLLDDVYLQLASEMPPMYAENTAKVREAAERTGIKVVPTIFNVGYSWRVLYYDSNLAAGLPARDVPFVVDGAEAAPDPDAVPEVVNAGFDEAGEDGLPAGWSADEGAGESISIDTEVAHSGEGAMKMTDFDKLPQERRRRNCRVMQTLDVEPFKYYRLTIWRKTENVDASSSTVLINNHAGTRRLCYTNFEINPEQDWEDYVAEEEPWKEYQLTFNTLDSDAIDIQVGLTGARSGTVWWDELKLEPAGLCNVLRGETTPVVVKSAERDMTFEKGRDFITVVDPMMGMQPMPSWLSYLPPGGSYDIYHEGPKLRLTEESRIEDGERLLLSYYHPHIIYGHQVNCSLTDPKVFEIFDHQLEALKKLWDVENYVMAYDEIRTAGWEVPPGGGDPTPGELLADHISRAWEIGKKHFPDANFYVWSDMFDPYHNAYAFEERNHFYYLCDGNYDGSWEGLPAKMRIIKWGPKSREALKFFTDRGNKLIFSGDRPESLAGWFENAKGLPGILGAMYTTWSADYEPIEEYSKAVDQAPSTEAE